MRARNTFGTLLAAVIAAFLVLLVGPCPEAIAVEPTVPLLAHAYGANEQAAPTVGCVAESRPPVARSCCKTQGAVHLSSNGLSARSTTADLPTYDYAKMLARVASAANTTHETARKAAMAFAPIALSVVAANTGLGASGALRQAAVEVHDLATPAIRHNMSTIALAEVGMPGGGTQIFAAGSGGRLSAAQIARLQELGVPAGSIMRGPAHAEVNILNGLPEGAVQIRWGIAWAGGNKPIPCPACAPLVSGVDAA